MKKRNTFMFSNNFARSLIAVLLIVTLVMTFSAINPTPAEAAAVVNASSGTASAIQSAANSVAAAGGGTVKIPAGTFNLGGSVTIKANVALVGAGTNSTILRTSGTSQVINLEGNNTRVSNFSLISTAYNGGNGVKVGNCYNFRVDHMHIEGYSSQGAVYVRGANARGVVDHNYIKNKPASSLNYGVVVYAGDTWSSSPQLGTANAVFIEDNTFINCRHAVAANAGAHYVFRNNLVRQGVAGQAVDAHGPYYGGKEGTRAFEVYNNIIEEPQSSGSERAMCIRGGEGVIFNNTIRGYKYGVLFRIEDGQSGSYPLYHQPQNVYIWNNSCNGQYAVGYSSKNNTTTLIKENRDWFAKALPGYTPYVYPHPLVTETQPAPINQVPVAQNDSYSVNQGQTLNVAAPGVLSNDSDPEKAALKTVLASTTRNGSLTLNSNGSFSYKPVSTFSGIDTFTYRANDGASNSGAATVSITVNPIESTPVAGSDSFGLDSGNNTYNQLPSVINAMRFQNDAGSGTLTELQILISDTTPSGKVRIGIYSDNNNSPRTLLLDAGEKSVTNGWVTISSLNLPVQQGSYYWLAFNLQATNGVRYQSNGPTASHHRVTYTYGSLPSSYPLSSSLTNSNRYVMRATIGSVTVNPIGSTPVAGSDSFGLDSGNNTYNQLPSVINAMRFQNDTGSGTLTELQILISDTTPSGKVRIGIYSDNNNSPRTLLLDAGEKSIVNGWVTISSLNLPVQQGSYYWLAFNLQATNGVRYQSNGPTASHHRVTYNYGSLPSSYPLSSSLTNSNRYVMQASVVP